MTAGNEYGYQGSRYEPAAPAPDTSVAPPMKPRVTVTWEGDGQPIVMTAYARSGKIAVPVTPRRALEIAQLLIDRALLEGDCDDQEGRS